MAKSGQANDSSGPRAGRLRLIGAAFFLHTLGTLSCQVERGVRRKMRRQSTHNLGSRLSFFWGVRSGPLSVIWIGKLRTEY